MKSLAKLIDGEMKRLLRYKILPVSLATTFIWIVLLLFLSQKKRVKWHRFLYALM